MQQREPDAAIVPPSFFTKLGPSLDDWENYLDKISEELESMSGKSTTQEGKLFFQGEDPAVQELEEKYHSVISSLRSKLDSKEPPPNLHLDTSLLQEASSALPVTSGVTNAPFSVKPWSLLSALMAEIKNLDHTGMLTTDTPQIRDASTVSWDATENHHTLGDRGPPSTSQSTNIAESGTTAPPKKILQRKYRSLLRKRQTSPASGRVCPAVRESSHQVSQVRDSYQWVLSIPNKSLRMSFQEVLVDLSSKNDRGLYQARVRALVGGKPLTFYCLVGLENESFYRSVPRIIAVALDALKT